MALQERTKEKIYNAIWYIGCHKDIKDFKFGITRMGILNRFPPHKNGEGYEQIISLADNLSMDDAKALEQEIHEYYARDAKYDPEDNKLYKKYVHKDKRHAPSVGRRGDPNGRCYSVYMVW